MVSCVFFVGLVYSLESVFITIIYSFRMVIGESREKEKGQ